MVVSVTFFATNLLIIKTCTTVEPNASPFILCAARAFATQILLTPLGMLQAYQSKTSFSQSLIAPFKIHPVSTYVIGFMGIIYETMIAFVCLGVMPIVMVAIFINVAPLFTVLLAVPILGEKFSVLNVI